MLQRIQTLFLVLAAAAFISMFYLPFAQSDVAAGAMMTDKEFSVEDHILLGALCLLGGTLSLVAIFLYKNRPLQMRLGYFVIIAAILLVIASVLLFLQESSEMDGNVNVSESFGLLMPVITIILVVLANRFIKKDEKLVRSMDRLR